MAVRNLTAGKIRSLPVSQAEIDRMYAIAQAIDTTLGLDIVSGGQAATGPNRTGSHRHDVDASGVGHTADIVLTRGGQQLLPDANKQLYADYFRQAAPVFPGMGHYPWGIHVGGGSSAFWGPDKTAATADPAFLAAYQQGRGGAAPVAGGTAQPFQPAFGDLVSPTSVATTSMPMANVGLGFIKRAEERRERERQDEEERRMALFGGGLGGLYG